MIVQRPDTAAKADALGRLLGEIRACRICVDLPLGPRPVLQAGATARLQIIGQAPGRKVHELGIPWADMSGNRLRDWLVALVIMNASVRISEKDAAAIVAGPSLI